MRVHPVFYILAVFLIGFGMFSAERMRNYLLSGSKGFLSSVDIPTYTVRQVNAQKPSLTSFAIKGYVAYICEKCVKKRIVLSDQKTTLLNDSKLSKSDAVIYVSDTTPFILNNFYTLKVKPLSASNRYSLEFLSIVPSE